MHAVQSHHRAIMRNVELIVASGAKFPCLTQQYTALHRAHIAAGSTQLCFLVESPGGASRRYLTKRRFETWDTLATVEHFARSLPGVPRDLKLENVTVSPVVQLDLAAQRGHTLEGLGMWPSGLVLIRAAA